MIQYVNSGQIMEVRFAISLYSILMTKLKGLSLHWWSDYIHFVSFVSALINPHSRMTEIPSFFEIKRPYSFGLSWCNIDLQRKVTKRRILWLMTHICKIHGQVSRGYSCWFYLFIVVPCCHYFQVTGAGWFGYTSFVRLQRW